MCIYDKIVFNEFIDFLINGFVLFSCGNFLHDEIQFFIGIYIDFLNPSVAPNGNKNSFTHT